MAAVSVTKDAGPVALTDNRKGLGLVTVRTSALATASATEWIAAADLGMSFLHAVVGFAILGATTSTVAPSFELNAQGTDVAEGTNDGDLDIESTDAGINEMQVTVLGVLS